MESALDILSLGIFAWAAKQESKPEPFKFPIGKSNIEVVANVGFAALMGGAALVVMSQGIQALATGIADGTDTAEASAGLVPIVLISVAVLAKMALYVVCSAYASRSLAAAALAQDHWNDCFSTAFTLVAILLVSFFFFFWWVDATAAVVMSIIIIRTWWGAAQDHTELLLGRWAPPAQHSKVLAVALLHDERIEAIEHLNAYTYGERTQVELDIVLPPDMPNCTAHDIAEGLQFKIESLPFVARAYVHIDWRIPLGDSPGIPEHITPFTRLQSLKDSPDAVRTQETPAMELPAAQSAMMGMQQATEDSDAVHLEVLSEGGPQEEGDEGVFVGPESGTVAASLPTAHPIAHKAASDIIHRHSSLQFTRMRVGGGRAPGRLPAPPGPHMGASGLIRPAAARDVTRMRVGGQMLDLGGGLSGGTGVSVDTTPPAAGAFPIQRSISTPHGALDQLSLGEKFAGFENVHPDVIDGKRGRAVRAAAHKTARRARRRSLLAEQDRVLRHIVLRESAASVASPAALSETGDSAPPSALDAQRTQGGAGFAAARIPASLISRSMTQQLPAAAPSVGVSRGRGASAGDAAAVLQGSAGGAAKPVAAEAYVTVGVGGAAMQHDDDLSSSSDEDDTCTAHIRLGASALPPRRDPRPSKHPKPSGGFCNACCSIADTQPARVRDL